MPKSKIDWDKIEPEYCSAITTIQQVADKFGVSCSQLRAKARELNWVRASRANLTKRASNIDSPGFVYVVYIIDNSGAKYYKVGIASNFINRLSVHQTSSPFNVSVAMCYYTKCMRSEELEIFSLFKEKQVRGEWYKLDSNDLTIIAQRAIL